jgi:hypothetical protein
MSFLKGNLQNSKAMLKGNSCETNKRNNDKESIGMIN